MFKRIELSTEKEKGLKARGFDFDYSSRSGEVLLKFSKNQNELDLVIEFLSDIISFI